MRSDEPSVSRLEDEKQLLRFLCAPGEDVTERRNVCQRVNQYSWRDNDHGVLFETIGELLSAAPHEVLPHLPAALTRRGFPDLACDWLATPTRLNTNQAFALAEELLRASQ
jgi:hypothetical protein